MAARKQYDALRKAYVRADGDHNQIVDPYIFTYPSVIADGKIPWVLDVDARFNGHPFADLCAEHPEQAPF
jgi:hypothetical protein